MTDRDHQLLVDQMESTAATVRAFAAQIATGAATGEYVTEELAVDLETLTTAVLVGPVFIETLRAWMISESLIDADDVDDYADLTDLEIALEGEGYRLDGAEVYKRDEHDEPTVDGESIHDYPLEVVDERGREFAVVLSTGGPHIEVVADGGNRARLEGYWWGDRHTMTGDYFDVFLDHYIVRD